MMLILVLFIMLMIIVMYIGHKKNKDDDKENLEIFRRRLVDIGDMFTENKDGDNNIPRNHNLRHHRLIHRHNLSHHSLNRTSMQQKILKLYTIISDLDKAVDALTLNQKSKAEPLLDTPFDWSFIENRANFFYNNDANYKNNTDPKSLMLLGVYDELLYRRMPQWFDVTNGFHIKTATELEFRLRQSRELFHRDCRRDNILLYMCTISKNNAPDLQEWLVWQIVVVGVHHVIIYLNGPDEDNSIEVLQPFVDLGYVTAINATGTARQYYIYNMCIDLVKKKSCNYGGPMKDKRFLDVSDCDPSSNLDSYNGRDRPVFVAGFDDDEMAIDIAGGCVIDQLANYLGANGLMLPWVVFGHNNHFLTPKNQLNIESYRTFLGNYSRIGGMGKAFNRARFIKTMNNSHEAYFINDKATINEYGLEVVFTNVGFQQPISEEDFLLRYGSIKPRVFLGHYMTKSVEHLVKKYVRGRANTFDLWGRPLRRDLDTIMEWLKQFSIQGEGGWMSYDEYLYNYTPLIRYILFGENSTIHNKTSVR